MSRPPEIEYELGVPFPGRVLARAQWTRTGLKDPPLPFDWEKTFGRDGPRVVDLGCGNGRSVIVSAMSRPSHLHLGLDVLQVAVDYGAQRANRRGLTNARFAVGDAATWMQDGFGPASLDEIHIYHPQPYYEADAAARRLLTPAFLERSWTVLKPGGKLILQTDNKAYWGYLCAAVAKHFEATPRTEPWPDSPQGRTRREIQSRRNRLNIWRMEAVRRTTPLDIAVPAPDFEAVRPRFRHTRKRVPQPRRPGA